MIISEIMKQIQVTLDALQNITFQVKGMVAIMHRIAENDYQKEVVDTGMIELEDKSKEDWIKNRFDYYLSEEFMND